MRYQVVLSALAAAGFSSASAAADAKSDVFKLGKDSFDAFVKDNNLVLAEFFAPWCGHCKALAPEYEIAATELKGKGISLAQIDCTEEAELCQAHGVEGYPTLKVFRGLENVTPFGGQRKADSIISYMTKQSLPSVSIVNTEMIEAFKTADKVVLIAYFEADDKTSNETYAAVADTLRDSYLFGATSDAALTKAAGVTAPALVLYKNFDEPTTVFDGKFETAAITAFAKTASVPLIGEVGPETYAGYMAAGIPLAYIFIDKTAEPKSKLAEELKAIATEFKGKINFATIDAVAFGAHAANLNLEQTWPAFAIQDTVKNQKFPFDQTKDLTAEAIGKFVKDFVAGDVKPSIKSEPVPETQEGPVYTIVAHNYDDIIIKNDKDVLVEFYAHWCGHCKALAPKYEELGALYFNNPAYADKVSIAKVDATLNDVPDEIQGFPTIKLFAAGKKGSPIDYTGSRTMEDLAEFIKDHGTHKVDAFSASEAGEATEAAETIGKVAPAATEMPEAKRDADSAPVEADEDNVEDIHDEL